MERPIIIDTDLGFDDAIALILASKLKTINIVGITTVAGATNIENTSKNALDLLSTIGWEIPVAIGSANPLVRERKLSSRRVRLGTVELIESTNEFYPKEACELIYEEAKKYDGKLEILAIGPMTNIAKAIIRYPELKSMIKAITFMGGTTRGGNITPSAEFNMYVDPNAADTIFKSKIPLNMIGLDVTKKAFLVTEDIYYFNNLNNLEGNIIAQLLHSIHSKECLFGENIIEIHDAVALFAMMFPEVIKMRKFNVSVETQNKEYLGMLLLDYRDHPDKDKNVNIAIDIDIEVFKNWLRTLVC